MTNILCIPVYAIHTIDTIFMIITICAHRFDISFRQIPVQFSQVEKRERHADDVDDDPQSIEYIMAKRSMH